MLKSSLFYATLFASSVQAMDHILLPMRQPESVWDDYLENGDITAPHQDTERDERLTLQLHHNIIDRSKNLDPILNNPSTPEFAALLDSLPANVIATRYENYERVFKTFMSMVIIKQYALNMIRKYTQSELATFTISPATCFKDAENRMAALSQWLDAIRSSGEENYVCKYPYSRPPTHATPSAFWQSSLENHVLFSLRGCYYDPTTHLDPTSMAILRHQLRKGFPDLEYKKNTAYTGTALCRVKIKGEEPSDWDFQTFMKTLELAAQEEKHFSRETFFPAWNDSLE